MNILFTITYFAPYVSGLSLAAERWANGLVRNKQPVTVLSMRHDDILPEFETREGIHIERARALFRVSKGIVSIDWLVKLVRLLRTTDTVVIHLPEFEGIVAALFAKLSGKRTVVIYHCEVELPHGPLNEIVQSLLEVSNFASLLLADTIVTYTNDYADHSKLIGLLRNIKPSSVIQAIVPPIDQPGNDVKIKARLRRITRKTPYVIGIAARLAEEKGIEYVFQAIPLLKKLVKEPFVIVIAGSPVPVGEASYQKKIQTLLKSYKHDVKFIGEIAPDHMGSFYSALTVLVLPSVNSTEAFGMVQVEAMLCGVPVVASDLPGVRVPIQTTGMGRLVPIRDSAALASAIANVIQDKKNYSKSHAHIRQLFQKAAAHQLWESILGIR